MDWWRYTYFRRSLLNSAGNITIHPTSRSVQSYQITCDTKRVLCITTETN